MSTPRSRHWRRTSGPQFGCGLLIGLGLLILLISQFQGQTLSTIGFRIGMTLCILGLGGLFAVAGLSRD